MKFLVVHRGFPINVLIAITLVVIIFINTATAAASINAQMIGEVCTNNYAGK